MCVLETFDLTHLSAKIVMCRYYHAVSYFLHILPCYQLDTFLVYTFHTPLAMCMHIVVDYSALLNSIQLRT